MSNTKREPLLSDDGITKMVPPEADFYDCELIGNQVREVYEAARAKDAESIQRLTDYYEAAIAYNKQLIQGLVDLGFHDTSCSLHCGRRCDCLYGVALERAEDAGFKPSDQ